MHSITAYQCDHCKSINISIKNMKRHERKCHLDPANKSCATCLNLETVELCHDVYVGDGEVDTNVTNGPWCASKGIELNPLQTKCDKWESLPNNGVAHYFLNKKQTNLT